MTTSESKVLQVASTSRPGCLQTEPLSFERSGAQFPCGIFLRNFFGFGKPRLVKTVKQEYTLTESLWRIYNRNDSSRWALPTSTDRVRSTKGCSLSRVQFGRVGDRTLLLAGPKQYWRHLPGARQASPGSAQRSSADLALIDIGTGQNSHDLKTGHEGALYSATNTLRRLAVGDWNVMV
jgi:hypothetical protein